MTEEKRKLHIHSDNSEWAGSENMPGVLLGNDLIKEKYDLSFSFRNTPEYVNGFNKHVKSIGFDICPMDFSITKLYSLKKYFKSVMCLKVFCMLEEIFKLYSLFKKIEPDILHINNGGFPAASSCNSAAIAGKLAGVSRITYTINSSVKANFLDKVLASIVSGCVDFFVSASQHLKDNSETLKREGNWCVIPNTLKYEEPRFSPEEIRKDLGIKEDQVFYLNVGVIEHRKSQHFLPRFFRDNSSAFVVIKGEDKGNLDLIKKNIIEYGVFDYFKILTKSKYTDRELINACDYFILPSEYDEDFPNVLLLAMMYGKPAIANKLAGIPEIINHRTTGYLYNNTYVSDCVGKALDKIERDAFMFDSEAIKSRYYERYNEDKIVNKFIKIWEVFGDL